MSHLYMFTVQWTPAYALPMDSRTEWRNPAVVRTGSVLTVTVLGHAALLGPTMSRAWDACGDWHATMLVLRMAGKSIHRARNRPIGIDDSTSTMSRNRNLSAIVLLEQYSAKNTVPVFLIWRD